MKLGSVILLLVVSSVVGFGPATAMELVEGWNVDNAPLAELGYGAPCWSLVYRAHETYFLERVEFWIRDGSGLVTVEVQASGGCPAGEVLGSGSYLQVNEIGWQGADIDLLHVPTLHCGLPR